MNLDNKITPRGILDAVLGKKKGDTVEITLPDVNIEEQKEVAEKGNRLRITIKLSIWGLMLAAAVGLVIGIFSIRKRLFRITSYNVCYTKLLRP